MIGRNADRVLIRSKPNGEDRLKAEALDDGLASVIKRI